MLVEDLLTHVLEALAPLGVESRRLFGSHALYHEGRFFGFIAEGRLYFHTDSRNRPDYLARDMPAFQPVGRPRDRPVLRRSPGVQLVREAPMARSNSGTQLSWERPRLLDSAIELALKSSGIAIVVPSVLAAAWLASGRSLDAAAEAGDVPAMPLLTGLLASFVMVPMLALAGATAALLSAAWTLRGPEPVPRRALRATLPLAVAAAGLAAAYFHVAVLVPVMTGA